MDVQNLTVGPITGHTSHNLVRIFGRAELSIYDGRPRKAHGVIQYRKMGKSTFSTPLYFKMNPNFDLTGVVVLTELEENIVYEYQVGWFYSEVDSSEINVDKVLNWKHIDIYQMRTASSDISQARTIVFGSCRYVLRLFGGLWWDDRSDRTFKSILEHTQDSKQVDQLIMCGDQIYADDLNVICADDSLDEYNKRYRKVFTSKYLRRLMSCTPTYMTLDDHEIEDNWPESANAKDWVTKFPAAIHSYATYQASHSPLFDLNGSRITGAPTHLWYTYSDGCCDVFVCDTRTERDLTDGAREMLGPMQMTALKTWLCDGSERVKMIVSSVPPYESQSSDKWHGFIHQRDEIFECIRINEIQKVVFLSGDVHACMASQLELSESVNVTSVVSSALFWPYPHPNRRSFKLRGTIDTLTSSIYKVKKSSEVFPTDAFTKLRVSPSGLRVEFYARKGKKLGSKSYKY